MSLGAGFLLARMGGVSLNYTESETHNGVNTRVTSASYSRGLTKATSLFVTASANRALDTTYGFFVGLNFNLEKNMRGAAQYGRTGNADTETVQIQKDMPIGEGLGYRAALNRSDTGASTAYTFNPSLQYNARYGAYTLGSSIRNSHGKTSESHVVTAAGSLVYAGGFYGLARPVNDSFGIVMVNKVPNATVLNNGQEIGRTGPSGMMVVPTLASYNQNQITLDVKNIPMDYSISGVNAKISPSQWSGSCVSFDARKVQAVTGTLYTIRADKKIPLEYVDISIKVGEREVTSPTGKGGEFYMENSLPDDLSADAVDRQSCRAIAERGKSGGNMIKPGTYQAQVDYEGGKCEFAVTFPDTEDVITDIGEARCVVSEKAGQEMVEVEKKPKGAVPKPKQPVVEVEKEERKSPEEERRSLHLNMIKVYFDDIQAQEARISHTVNPKVIGNYVEKRNHTGAYYRTEQDVLLCEAGLCEQQWTALFNYTDEAGKADTISMTWKQTVFTGITPAGTSKRELLYCLNGVCERLEDATAADKPRTAETGRYHLTWTRSLLVIRRADIMKEINEAGGLVDAY